MSELLILGRTDIRPRRKIARPLMSDLLVLGRTDVILGIRFLCRVDVQSSRHDETKQHLTLAS